MQKHMGNIRRHWNSKIQKEILEIKVIVLKIAFDGLIGGPDTTEERISKPEKLPVEALKTGTQRKGKK